MRLFLLTTAVVLSANVAAHATVTYKTTPSTTTSPNGLMSSYAGVTTLNFNGATIGTTPAGFAGGVVLNGSSTNQFQPPNGDSSNFFAVGAPPSYTGTSTFTPGASYNYFGFYWGSIDAYNTISFFSNGTSVGSVSGSQLVAANDTSATNSNQFVDFFLSSGTTYDTVVFNTTSANFELDNVAYGNVAVTPEPSSFALLGTGLLGIAGVLKRRLA
ncbi:MAG: PEP-CTERM sorting domain-containing protein [Janthinobacterium lividum]